MHEYSVMTGVVNSILDKIKGMNVKRVERVDMIVGELTFLSPEQMKFAFDVLTEGTLLEGAELNIEVKKARIKCRKCGYEGSMHVEESKEYHFELPVFKCPKCGGEIDIIEGKECMVKNAKIIVDD
ncbi:MAG: hydrogenase maturation nickel metallochaperone HypA [Thermoplasmata archaeon]|nr:hydrogenase maturation nickel metallochaperone HypA [Thermoplasmata archaeon]